MIPSFLSFQQTFLRGLFCQKMDGKTISDFGPKSWVNLGLEKSYLVNILAEKTADFSRRYKRFPRKMTSEKRA